MRIDIEISGDPTLWAETEIRAAERAVTRGVAAAGQKLKSGWRAQIESAGLGKRLARTIRARTYPEHGASIGAAALVWSKAPVIVGAHDTGPLIRSKHGFWLAIPLPAAGKKGPGGKRITPGGWEKRTGMRLRFVYRRSGPSLLVADDARLSGKRQLAAPNRRRRRKDGILTGAMTVPVFLLVPQVKLRKRLDLARDARAVEAALPGMVVERWGDGPM